MREGFNFFEAFLTLALKHRHRFCSYRPSLHAFDAIFIHSIVKNLKTLTTGTQRPREDLIEFSFSDIVIPPYPNSPLP